jgi:hypothetical protein
VLNFFVIVNDPLVGTRAFPGTQQFGRFPLDSRAVESADNNKFTLRGTIECLMEFLYVIECDLVEVLNFLINAPDVTNIGSWVGTEVALESQ